MSNLLGITNYGVASKQWLAGLSSYTQSNCSVSLTDNGYRIYRPPNLTVADNGYTMWGGLVIKPFNIIDNILQKGHTYILKFHIKGKSSNAAEYYWTNQCGWGGGGLDPSPSNTSVRSISSNFQGEIDFFYKWTINDDIVKTCTNSYSGFVAGTQYISYRDFKWGFGYTSTGELGTDLYITNLRLYDITSGDKINIEKSGVIEMIGMTDSGDSARIEQDSEIIAANIIEF